MEIQYDKPIEVSQKHYNILMNDCAGIVAGQEIEVKYYVKVLLMKYHKYVKQILNN